MQEKNVGIPNIFNGFLALTLGFHSAVFRESRMISYAALTDQYYPAILEEIKKIPEWNNAWWLIRYQLMTMLETCKRLL